MTQQSNREGEERKMVAATSDRRWMTTVMMTTRGNSRGRKEEKNMTIEGRRSREGPKDATQQPTNGGVQLEAEALAERRRQANGQQDNQ